MIDLYIYFLNGLFLLIYLNLVIVLDHEYRYVHMFCVYLPFEFKAVACSQVSPHEFLQAVMKASKKRFRIGVQSDPVEFMSWLLNTLHTDLRSSARNNRNIIHQCFQVLNFINASMFPFQVLFFGRGQSSPEFQW